MKTILFDMDGTLFDTEKYYKQKWEQALREYGYEMTSERLLMLRSLGRPFCIEQFQNWFGKDFDYWKVLKRRRALMDELLAETGIPLKPAVRETLKTLHERGYHLAVVTATGIERTRANLVEAGIYELFDEVVCGPMVERGKPAPDIYLYACERLDISPGEAFAVEDSPNGVRSAHAAGCRVIMIPDLTQPDGELEKMLYRKADCLKDLLEIL